MSSTRITQQIYYHCIHSLGKPSVMTETDEREEQNLWEQENKTMKNRGGVEQSRWIFCLSVIHYIFLTLKIVLSSL